ncbi:hypothetical protein HZS61_002447 [Fusarium oxysporum f. sp. conglutinans]|uniref:Integrase catalytic domain-containing protein n=2 Tax=Fusarium oxysporum TaxID=5507 RepID=A0A8H6GHC0_FUSOX|nr:hypothetical protein HZS61_002447 [Fusarium oxysporum f. sp. conglutinans]KAH7465306.1 hypothetical protein FOMA001_g17226 [Fusarium oxysporum f. sp. matthiolae]RKK06735.1 hypothetical protein BFJ65_g18287 [Fusarium oxysporum f. sp. cepae]RKK21108.1 hypothetical protein BFJ67_g17459 [Fusarium oxysporum f. sp. cepae]RKK26823.1 hypothetical protein BFJ66_g16942 [Fusarium oxysporum f. sp. cepae]
MLITDRWSGMIWDYYLADRHTGTLITALKDLFGLLERQYQLKPKVLECDNEIPNAGTVFEFLRTLHIKVEPSAPYTQAQNGGAEVSGKIIKNKARAMRAGARLPEDLWVEIYRAAVYLYNRTPRYTHNWRTPYDKFHTFLAHRDGIVVEDRKPYQAHLRVYGCKAFAMTREAKTKQQKKHRLNPRAWIGFLVGYQSTNIYRIWNPHTGVVVPTRDVIFNEDEHFNGDINQLKDDLLHIGRQELIDLLSEVEEPAVDHDVIVEEEPDGAHISQQNWESSPGEDEELEPGTGWEDPVLQAEVGDTGAEQSDGWLDHPTITDEGSGITGDADTGTGKPESDTRSQAEAGSDTRILSARTRQYATPVSLPPTALLSMTSGGDSDDLTEKGRLTFSSRLGPIEAWKAAFAAGRQSAVVGTINGRRIDKAKLHRMFKSPQQLHRRQMPPLPRHHGDLATHPMGSLFQEAEAEHLRSHEEMRSWTEIQQLDPRTRDQQVLDCMWVYVYKFDKHGRFKKCKARLVVRGDQQLEPIHEETYAATLAGRSFRTLMAIAARFDLELIQYDAVNAFVNAKLDKPVFMRMPPGYRKPRTVLMLQKALYGLRESPLLWQKELTATLSELGFQPVPHEPCCMTKGGIIVFFYVDDIVLAYRKRREDVVQRITRALQNKYKLTGGSPLQWFLGIEIIRDREKKLLWLSQSDYIDKIANLADRTDLQHDVPMRREELLPYEELASLASIRRYQRKTGSILYAAVITRPDVAFAASRLARHNSNPGPEHHAAADRVLLYLKTTKTLALQFGGDDVFTVASDASFADNALDRKSSQAYVMRLFGGTVGWRANKQATVTTSTTEAELLALAQAAKEAMFVSRLIKQLGIHLDEERIQIQCDNQQTIQLVHKDIARLQTKLKHVNIHDHWLRQEAQRNRIKVEYRPTTDMIADGLTKALTRTTFRKFVNHIGLVDISDQLDNRHTRALNEEDLQHRIGALEL